MIATFDPTLALLNVPACFKLTTSPPTTPTKEPPHTLTLVVPSYTLESARVPATVRVLVVRVTVFRLVPALELVTVLNA